MRAQLPLRRLAIAGGDRGDDLVARDVTLQQVTALAENGGSNYGLHNSGGATKADNSQFTGSSNGLYLDGGTVYLGVSQLDGGATNSSGTLTCFQVYDGSYSDYTCP